MEEKTLSSPLSVLLVNSPIIFGGTQSTELTGFLKVGPHTEGERERYSHYLGNVIIIEEYISNMKLVKVEAVNSSFKVNRNSK